MTTIFTPHVSPLVPSRLWPLFPTNCSLTVETEMADCTETLTVGSLAAEFSLLAANREGAFSLSALREQGTVILEFLRGTW